MIGRKLHNRYLIESRVGEGSTATVYRALDTRLNRPVALKVLLPSVRDTTRKRFLQEALAAAQLNHPNIMAIYDMDREGDLDYLVVEYVDGQPLSDFIPTTAEQVVELGTQIARALHYAHERQVIHRDIKPANIKVTPSGVVKLMDLGLALPRDATRVTADGMIIGTPAYLSPEQAQGVELDNRTDIYSLGIVLYELATGQLPFDSDDIPALLLQQVKQPPPPPRLLSPDLPVALEVVILKALEKNRNRRYQTAEALANALQASLSGGSAVVDTQPARPTGKLTLRVLLADDHALLRRALAGSLAEHDDLMVVGEASNGEAALTLTLDVLPDVLVLDLNMPGKGGLEILPEIRAQAPTVRVLVLTGRAEEWYITQALRAGAHGYILKSAEDEDLPAAIIRVAKGDLVLGRGVAEKVVTGMLNVAQSDAGLTDTEKQILLNIAWGMDNETIARQMGLPVMQVIEAVAGLMDRLDARDRYAAVLHALRRGLITLEEVQTLHE